MLDELLLARSEAEFDAAREAGFAAFRSHFPEADWTCLLHREVYTEQNYKTLWDPPSKEMRTGLKTKLEAAGKTRADYAEWLGETHWVQATAYSNHLFADGYKANQGWRIIALGIPPVRTIILGLASHYQQAQAHNKLARASNLFHRHIEALAVARGQEMVGRPVAEDDWERCGLLTSPVLDVAGVSISDLESDPAGLWLKDMRGSTLRKILVSFITLVPIAPSQNFAAESGAALDELRSLGAMLLGPA